MQKGQGIWLGDDANMTAVPCFGWHNHPMGIACSKQAVARLCRQSLKAFCGTYVLAIFYKKTPFLPRILDRPSHQAGPERPYQLQFHAHNHLQQGHKHIRMDIHIYP